MASEAKTPQAAFLRRMHAFLRGPLDEAERALFGHDAEVDALRADTALALGGAFGAMSKACALLGRDLDDAKAAAGAAPPT